MRPVAVAQGVLAALSFLLLIWLFLRTDLSVELVAANSHSAKPWLYKFAGAWGNHEGSMLLWVTVLAVAGGAVALFERRLRAGHTDRDAGRAGRDRRSASTPSCCSPPTRSSG